MREAIKQAARDLPTITEVPRLAMLDAAAFRARAARWPKPFPDAWAAQRWSYPPGARHLARTVQPCPRRYAATINTASAADRAKWQTGHRGTLWIC